MDYCKYHPLSGATYVCHNCTIHQCDKCIDDDPKHAGSMRCFLCGAALESLGSGNTVEPFWRRLPEAFKYPINSASLGLVIGMSVVAVVASLISSWVLIAIFMYLFAAGALLKYSFTCLERTAMGEMKAPDVMEAYQGGIKLLFQLFFVTFILLVLVGTVAQYLGLAIGGLLGVVAVIAYPAILIRLALTESALEALNPVRALAIISAIGLPYGLLIGFIMMMMTSVAVLHEWIGNLIPTFSYVLQSIVSNYYTLVVFHLMGYVLFQYQGRLGYSARVDDDEETLRPDIERFKAQIEILLKEGEYEQMVDLYYRMFKQFPEESQFYDKYFDLLYACKKSALMMDFANLYLQFILRKKRFDKLTTVYKQILLIAPDYVPGSADLRLQIARMLTQQGDSKLAIKLLNGLHKQHPDFPDLVVAYQLMAGLLEDMPGMQAQGQKCRQLIEQLKRKAAEKSVASQSVPFTSPTIGLPTATAGTGNPARRPPPVKASGLTLELVPMEPSNPQNQLGE